MTTKRLAAILVAFTAINGVTGGALAAPGELDSTFGDDGFARIDSPNDNGRATAIVAQSDGKLLVGRDTVLDTEDLSVLRLNPDGSLDSTFAAAGRASVSVPGASGRMLALVRLSGGDIVAAGAIPENDTIVGVYDLGLVRYLADGRADSGFGANSVARARFAALTIDAATVVEQPDGKLVASVGGVFVFAEYGWKADFAAKGMSSDLGSSMLLVRFDVAGAVDTGFGTDGFVSIDPSGSYESGVRWLTQQADGKLVAVGFVGPDMAVIRLTADGLLDPTFNGDGLVILPSLVPGADARADAVVVQGDGKIAVAGTTGPCASDDAVCDDAGEAAVARLNADGSLDATFGFGGRATFSIRGWERIEVARGGLAIEPDGTLVVGGRAGPGSAEPSDSRYGFVARLTSSGEHDVDFGDDGVTLLDVGRHAATSGIAGLESGAIAVAMSAFDFYTPTGDAKVIVARLAPSAGNPGVLGLAQGEVRAREGTHAQFVVRRTGGTTGAVGIDYRTTCYVWGGGCFDTADYADYTPTSGTLTWADGDGTDRTVAIPILADNVVEGDETFDFY
ncbi:MAG TPA: Calx-beta domain-containing protein, partial [Gammaproteobacteria bacterium]